MNYYSYVINGYKAQKYISLWQVATAPEVSKFWVFSSFFNYKYNFILKLILKKKT